MNTSYASEIVKENTQKRRSIPPSVVAQLQARGIRADQIVPGSLHTFGGWVKRGRIVRRGEKGVGFVAKRTIPVEFERLDKIGSVRSQQFAGSEKEWVVVYHVFQTIPLRRGKGGSYAWN